jgi:hypothetical protein
LLSGEIDGECNVTGSLTVLPMGLWKGTIKATTVVVAGTVEGDIIASGRVEISDTARITGTVTADAIAVAEGAIVQGKMKTTSKADPVEFVEKRKAEKSGLMADRIDAYFNPVILSRDFVPEIRGNVGRNDRIWNQGLIITAGEYADLYRSACFSADGIREVRKCDRLLKSHLVCSNRSKTDLLAMFHSTIRRGQIVAVGTTANHAEIADVCFDNNSTRETHVKQVLHQALE